MRGLAAPVLASIPSPSEGSIGIGPLRLNAYGLMIALGIVAAVWMFGRRLEQRRWATGDDAAGIAMWAVAAGIVGARAYHVITDWERFADDLGDVPKIWQGGLGIPGGLIGGIVVGSVVARRRGIPMHAAATCAAPALPLAQAIGRWGNWWNQELYGRPTSLPWALEIDDEHLVGGFAPGTTFHPTFLYESLWNLALCGVLLWIDARWRPRRGTLMAMYVAGYGLGRFWVEALRVDLADEVAGLRWNQWMALAAIAGGVAYVLLRRSAPVDPEPAVAGGVGVGGAADGEPAGLSADDDTDR
jgi:prolipoprotein diacylglyceryl transferase